MGSSKAHIRLCDYVEPKVHGALAKNGWSLRIVRKQQGLGENFDKTLIPLKSIVKRRHFAKLVTPPVSVIRGSQSWYSKNLNPFLVGLKGSSWGLLVLRQAPLGREL